MLLNNMIFYTFNIVKFYYICSQGILLSSNKLLDKFLFIVLFYRKFRICITNTSCKAHTPKDARAHP